MRYLWGWLHHVTAFLWVLCVRQDSKNNDPKIARRCLGSGLMLESVVYPSEMLPPSSYHP